MSALLAFLMAGCDDAQQKESGQTKARGKVATTYSVNGRHVQLGDNALDGRVSLLSAVTGDLNKDGLDDRAVVIVQNGAGSGVFYFVNVFLADGQGYLRLIGEEFLGDRIKFDFVDIYQQGSISSITGAPIHPNDYGQLVAAFSTRMNEQPLADEPNFYLTKHWKVKNEKLVLIENY